MAPPPKSGPAVSRDAEEDEEGSRGSALWRQLIPSKCLIIPARKVVHDAGREASVDESGTNAKGLYRTLWRKGERAHPR